MKIRIEMWDAPCSLSTVALNEETSQSPGNGRKDLKKGHEFGVMFSVFISGMRAELKSRD